jgi:AraC family transcriptional regulator
MRIIDRPAFRIEGKSTYISGPDNDQFGHFWQECQANGLMDVFDRLTGFRPGLQTGGTSLGVSRVERDPARRDFDYMIAVELDENINAGDLESYTVPAGSWAVFECPGPAPESIVVAEMYCFMEWLPQSGYAHDNRPEMEVYLPDRDGQKFAEFWLPVKRKEIANERMVEF